MIGPWISRRCIRKRRHLRIRQHAARGFGRDELPDVAVSLWAISEECAISRDGSFTGLSTWEAVGQGRSFGRYVINYGSYPFFRIPNKGDDI